MASDQPLPTFEAELEALLRFLENPPEPGSEDEAHFDTLMARVQALRPQIEPGSAEAERLDALEQGIAAMEAERRLQRESHRLAPDEENMPPTLGWDLKTEGA